MRRGWILFLGMWAFLVSGMLLVSHPADLPAGLQVEQAGGTALLALGSIAGIFSFLSFRGDCRRVASTLGEMTSSRRLHPIDPSSHELLSVTDGVNDVIQLAGQLVSDAQLRARELEIQLKVAQAEREHAEAIIYSISDAVLVTDPYDDLVLANESAARIFGFKLAERLRSPVATMVRDAKLIELIREMRSSDSRGGRRVIEHEVKTAEGLRTFKLTLSCLGNDIGPGGDARAGVVAVLQDITREREIAQIKNDFVSSVSHELRTPLASIKAYIEMLIDGEADDERTRGEFYDVIQNEANRLSRLIDNILNISRIESGLVRINRQPQSLMMIVKEAIEVIAPQARMKQIVLKDQLAPAIYQTNIDRDMLYQVVLNLLSNAIKYTPESGVVTVETVVQEDARKVVTRIHDTGVGIPPKDLPFVFDKFYRVDANNHMAKGTGLGLPLVKHIIETVHRGQVFIESEVGKGTTIGFDLDLV